MEVIRNLGGVQKGLLGGLILGILVVYLCLCISATGIVPLAPKAASLETGAQASVSTVAASTDSPPLAAIAALPTNTIAPTATPVPTEPPATSTPEPTLTPTSEPTVTPMPPVEVALVAAQPSEPSAPETQLVATKPPVRQPATAAQAVQVDANPAPTSTPAWTWRGIEYERVPGSKTGNIAAVLAVRVVGVPDRKVFVREVTGGWNTTLVTGHKSQYGDFSDDVGGLQPSTYLVKPMDIDDEVKVQINSGDFVLIEFALRPPANWTPEPATAVQAQATPAATLAPKLSSPPSTAPLAVAPATSVTSTTASDWAWRGIEYQRNPGTQTHNVFGSLAVRVVGVPDRKVFIREVSGGWSTTLVTGRKPEYGNFSDDVGGLEAGTYVVKPMDIDDQVSVQLNAGDFVLVEFALRPTHPLTGTGAGQPAVAVTVVVATAVPPKTVPATVAPAPVATTASTSASWTWQGLEYQRIPGARTGNSVGVLAVRVIGVPDRKVSVREISGGFNATLVTGRKPQYGEFSDEVGGLTPGVYAVKPMDIDNEIQVRLETGDFVLVEFALRPTKVIAPAGSTTTGATAPAAAQPQKTSPVS